MIKMGDKTIKESSVVATKWGNEKEINIEFEKDGNLEFDLDIVFCYDEDKETGEKTMTMIKVDNLEVTDEGGGNDLAGHLANAIYTVIRLQFQGESGETKDKWVKEVQAVIDEALENEDMEL